GPPARRRAPRVRAGSGVSAQGSLEDLGRRRRTDGGGTPVPRNLGGHAPGRGGLRRDPFHPEHGFGPVPRLRLADARRLDRGGPLVRPGAGRKAGDGDEGGRVGPRSETIRRHFGDYRKSELFSPMISCWPFGSRPSAERIVA